MISDTVDHESALFISPSPLKITGVSTGRRDRARVIFNLKAEKLIRAVSHTQNSQILRTKRRLTEGISKNKDTYFLKD